MFSFQPRCRYDYDEEGNRVRHQCLIQHSHNSTTQFPCRCGRSQTCRQSLVNSVYKKKNYLFQTVQKMFCISCNKIDILETWILKLVMILYSIYWYCWFFYSQDSVSLCKKEHMLPEPNEHCVQETFLWLGQY